jgi:tRNA-Thr(GGU) m(6)t(6)A37 methyltransferase TsaA
MTYPLEPIGVLRTPFPTKFGVPRQARLAVSRAVLELDPDRIPLEAVRGLEQASHVWIVFLFHAAIHAPRRATVRPPRLGGNRRVGVFATRSPFRPNPIGLSAVRLLSIEGLRLNLEGGDFLDRTPVLDIKPYLPWADAIPEARLPWAQHPPVPLPVMFSAAADASLLHHRDPEGLRTLIASTLAHDPRPAYIATLRREHAVALADVDVRFCVDESGVTVTGIAPASARA